MIECFMKKFKKSYFKTEKVEKDFETYIIDNKFDNNVSISELYGIDF